MTNKYFKISIIFLFLTLSSIYYQSFISADISLISRLRGMVLLQVEKHGEAWFVSPRTDERYFLGTPADTYAIMRGQGEGISNVDLKKIPIGLDNLSGKDSDGDGLPDNFENAIMTKTDKKDSDGDNYSDFNELLNNYEPNGTGKLPLDSAFAKKQAGKIFIQVEGNGEAWYVYPKNNKRYFMARPTDAFNLIRKLGMGIKNTDLMTIPQFKPSEKNQNNYIINNLTSTSTKDNTAKTYDDANLPFTFDFPSSWKIKKSDDFNNVIFLGDYDKDLFSERKAMIEIIHIKKDQDLGLANFEIAKKDRAIKTSNDFAEINGKKSYRQQFNYEILNSYEIITNIQITPREFVQIVLVSAGDRSTYNNVYDRLTNSISFK